MNKPKITAVKAESGNLALAIAEAALERKAGELLVLKVADVSYLADYFLMMTGYSRVQVRAIVDAIENKINCFSAEGSITTQSSWMTIEKEFKTGF